MAARSRSRNGPSSFLFVNKVSIVPFLGSHQFIVCSLLDNLSSRDNDNLVRISNGRQAMSNHYSSPWLIGNNVIKRLLHHNF